MDRDEGRRTSPCMTGLSISPSNRAPLPRINSLPFEDLLPQSRFNQNTPRKKWLWVLTQRHLFPGWQRPPPLLSHLARHLAFLRSLRSRRSAAARLWAMSTVWFAKKMIFWLCSGTSARRQTNRTRTKTWRGWSINRLARSNSFTARSWLSITAFTPSITIPSKRQLTAINSRNWSLMLPRLSELMRTPRWGWFKCIWSNRC